MLEPARLRKLLARRPLRLLERGELRAAAVLLPLFVGEGRASILLTRRTEHLPTHAGQIAFPGGVREVGDASLLACALREAEEEMGILPADVTVVGRLDDFVSVHNFHVTPYVGIIPHPYPYRVNRGEIAEVIELPLRAFLDRAVFHKEDWRQRGRTYPICFYTLDGYQIWGLTAAILRQLLKLLYGGAAPL